MKIFIILLLIIIPSFLQAQFQVKVLTGPVSQLTTTKWFVPLGFEIKPIKLLGLYAEFGIPLNLPGKTFNGEAKNFSTRVKFYKKELDSKIKFVAVEYNYTAEHYSRLDGIYYSKSGKEIQYEYADVTSVLKGVIIRVGGQQFLNQRIMVEWTLGIGVKEKDVRYSNVVEVPTPPPLPYSGWPLDIYLNFESKPATFHDTFTAFTPQPDNVFKKHSFIALTGSLRLGYLLVKGK